MGYMSKAAFWKSFRIIGGFWNQGGYLDQSEPETHREAIQHDCLPRFLGDGAMGTNKVCGEEYNIFYVPLPYILHLTDSCPFSK
jgi:hypothetical protein